MEEENIRALSEVLKDTINGLSEQKTTVNYLIETFHERGIGVVLFIFAAPMALPIPVPPGINLLLATPLVLLSLQLAISRHTIWIPEGIKSKSIDTSKLKSMFTAIIPILEKIELLVKPRFGMITQGVYSRIFGILALLMALTVCIPIPLTNTIPSLGIAIMSIGILSRDGLSVIIGALIGTLWIAILAFGIIYFGSEAFDVIKSFIKSAIY
jgi:hypothetical protein